MLFPIKTGRLVLETFQSFTIVGGIAKHSQVRTNIETAPLEILSVMSCSGFPGSPKNSEEAAKLIREKYPQDECADTWYPTLEEIKAEIDRYGVVFKINEVKEPVYVDGFCT